MEGKAWYLSKTVWGAVMALVGLVSPPALKWFGATPDEATTTIVAIVGAVVDLVGLVLVVVGRVKAAGPLTK